MYLLATYAATFKFPWPKNKKILSFKIKAYETVAFVGKSGAGKTTMVNLLMKFYDIKDGDIKIDGISTKNLSRENIHELFTLRLRL